MRKALLEPRRETPRQSSCSRKISSLLFSPLRALQANEAACVHNRTKLGSGREKRCDSGHRPPPAVALAAAAPSARCLTPMRDCLTAMLACLAIVLHWHDKTLAYVRQCKARPVCRLICRAAPVLRSCKAHYRLARPQKRFLGLSSLRALSRAPLRERSGLGSRHLHDFGESDVAAGPLSSENGEPLLLLMDDLVELGLMLGISPCTGLGINHARGLGLADALPGVGLYRLGGRKLLACVSSWQV